MKIITQNVFDKWDIEDNSVQSIITSPPYWQKRKYDIPDVVIGGDVNCQHEWSNIFTKPSGGKNHPDRPSNVGANRHMSDMDIRGVGVYSNTCHKCGAWHGQHGLEPDYQLFIKHILLWCQEARRVLKDDGIMFINYGDTYSTVSGGMASGNYGSKNRSDGKPLLQTKPENMPNKCKMMIPERIAIALIDEGWILRNLIIWHKVNSLPESVTDRFSNKYENIFMFVKQQKYYFDLDAVRVKQKTSSMERLKRLKRGRNDNRYTAGDCGQTAHGLSQPEPNINQITNTQAGNKQLMAQGEFHVNRPYTERRLNPKGKNPGNVWSIPSQSSGYLHYAMYPEKLVERMVLCSTKRGDTVLDPFVGSGTTIKVAEELNREGIGIDLGYEDIQDSRLRDIQKDLF